MANTMAVTIGDTMYEGTLVVLVVYIVVYIICILFYTNVSCMILTPSSIFCFNHLVMLPSLTLSIRQHEVRGVPP